MNSEEALENIVNFLKGLETITPMLAFTNYSEEVKIINKDLEILNTLKKYLRYSDSYYNNQADYGCAEITLRIEEDSIWLNDEQREQLKKDFNKVKEWLEDGNT